MISKILLIDDHPLIIQSYKNLLVAAFDVAISIANSQKEAQLLVEKRKIQYDIVILDLSMPDQNDYGNGFSKVIRHNLPNCKIVVITSHLEALVIYNLVKNIKPDGVILKSDLTPERFVPYFQLIFDGEEVYSPSVLNLLKKLQGEDYLDNYNRIIIIKLSQGILSKNLPNYLPLSMSAIDKRKAQIKEYFGICKGNDEDIIIEAKKRGLI